jgi:hypothetical protein
MQAIGSHGLKFSRFSMDTKYGFGKGGLPISVLVSDRGAEFGMPPCDETLNNDIEIGELVCLFSSIINEEIIEEISKLLLGQKKGGENCTINRSNTSDTGISNVIIASSLSLLCVSDTMMPFCRIALESVSYKNDKALASLQIPDNPSWALVLKSFSLQNLCPEGQFYPEFLGLLSPANSDDFHFQLRFFKSHEPRQVNNRLEIDFSVFIVRQFIHEHLQYFMYEHYGVGRLEKMFSNDSRDIYGNSEPPLLYTVYVYDTSALCSRHCSSSDMVALEVDDACISVSYIPESFRMTSESSSFVENPQDRNMETIPPKSTLARCVTSLSLSDHEDA